MMVANLATRKKPLKAKAEHTRPIDAHVGARKVRLFEFLAIAFQFGLFLIVLYSYDLESRAFLHLGIVAFFGFLIHYFLPFRFRRPFFAGLSIVCLATVFGFQLERWSLSGLSQAGWIIGLGLGIIGICHFPVSIPTRVLLVLTAAVVLCLLRAGIFPVVWSPAIWPVLGSMFMFRTAVYLYALRYDKKPVTFLDAICYFFMLPNPCFPLFPVVDFQAFRRGYYDAPDRHQIYQTGVTWMFRGTIHLLLYRYVYHHMVIEASAVATLPQLIQFLVWPFLLYLRVSGQFHIIVGLLHLFGFNLPETHRNYFLASSFTDFWRRINIYWKDFMMNLIFYPAYFRIRRWGDTAALAMATALVFFSTWILHAYQWFWIRGSWLLTWNDALFWAILAVLVIANALYEVKYGRRRSLGGDVTSWPGFVANSLKTISVFCTICLLWSFWSADSIGQWFSAFHVLSTSRARDFATVLPALVCLAVAFGAAATLFASLQRQRPFHFLRSATIVTLGFLLLIAFGTPVVFESLDPSVRGIAASLRMSDLNRRDFAKMERGYYENLLDVNRFNPELLDIYRTRPTDWSIGLSQEAYVELDHPPFFELRPRFEGRDRGAPVRTNSWGMRDIEYSQARPDGVVRMALVGSSFVMGVGVEADRTFEALLENRFNASTPDSTERCEILNFGVAGYTQLEHLGVMEHKVFKFSPNVVLYVEHGDPFRITMQGFVNHVRSGGIEHFDSLAEIAARAGVGKSTDPIEIKRKVQPYEKEILARIYQRMVEICRFQNVPAVWIYLPRPEEFDKGPSEIEVQLARDAGFHVLILKDVYQVDEFRSLWLARWDHHPNALANQMIAERLFEVLREDDVILEIESAVRGRQSNLQRSTPSSFNP